MAASWYPTDVYAFLLTYAFWTSFMKRFTDYDIMSQDIKQSAISLNECHTGMYALSSKISCTFFYFLNKSVKPCSVSIAHRTAFVIFIVIISIFCLVLNTGDISFWSNFCFNIYSVLQKCFMTSPPLERCMRRRVLGLSTRPSVRPWSYIKSLLRRYLINRLRQFHQICNSVQFVTKMNWLYL